MLKIRWQRPGEHIVAHGDIHEHQQKAHRKSKAAFQGGGFPIPERILFGGKAAPAFRRSVPSLEGRTVAGLLNCRNHGLRLGRTLNAHGIGQQADTAVLHAGNGGHRFLNACLTGCTAHAGNNILFHQKTSQRSRKYVNLS